MGPRALIRRCSGRRLNSGIAAKANKAVTVDVKLTQGSTIEVEVEVEADGEGACAAVIRQS